MGLICKFSHFLLCYIRNRLVAGVFALCVPRNLILPSSLFFRVAVPADTCHSGMAYSSMSSRYPLTQAETIILEIWSSLDCFTSAVNLLIIVLLYRMCFQVSTVSQFLCYHNNTISYSLIRPWILCKSHWVLQIFMNFQLTRRITNLRDGIFHFQDTHVSHREWVMVAVICYCDAISETTLGIVVSLSRKRMSSTSICYRRVCLRVFH